MGSSIWPTVQLRGRSQYESLLSDLTCELSVTAAVPIDFDVGHPTFSGETLGYLLSVRFIAVDDDLERVLVALGERVVDSFDVLADATFDVTTVGTFSLLG